MQTFASKIELKKCRLPDESSIKPYFCIVNGYGFPFHEVKKLKNRQQSPEHKQMKTVK